MGSNKRPWWYGVGGIVTLLVLAGMVTMLPDLVRYMKIRSM